MKNFLALLAALGLGALIILSLSQNELFNQYGEQPDTDRVSADYDNREYGDVNPDSGAANIVTSIVADFRSFDTLGEVTVLFVSSLGVALLLGGTKKKRLELDYTPNFMLRVGSKALFGIIIMTGVYMTIHGHLTPGGGFPGGTMIASSMLLLYLADDGFRTKVKGFKILESAAGSLYVLIGILGITGLVAADFFLQNFLPTGSVGSLLSAGIIPVVYVLIGLKVGSEISGVIDNFLTEESV